METYISRIYCQGDRIMAGVTWFLLFLSMAMAPMHKSWGLSLTLGLALTLASTVSAFVMAGSRFTRALNAVIFMAFAGLVIHQTHGMVEMHFSIFVLLAFLLFYRDWLPLVVGVLTVAVHHLGFYFLQSQGAEVYVFPHVVGIGMVFVHAAFAVFEGVILVYMAIQSRREASDVEQVSSLGSRIRDDGTIDLCVVKGSAIGYLGQRIEEFVFMIGNAVTGTRKIAIDVQAASESMEQVTNQIKGSSKQASRLAISAFTTSAEVCKNVSTVAGGSQGMLTSLRAIADSANEAESVAKNAVQAAQKTNLTLARLSESSGKIGQVAKVIAAIAEQTNLLALNATIEAARAGEAGKGFAVVANEVKELSKETAKATKDISGMIEAIQGDSKAALDAIATISSVIEQIYRISSNIASAVDDQNAATNEMARNLTEASRGSDEISGHIQGVAQATESAANGSVVSQRAAQQLVETSTQLQRLVERFKTNAALAPAAEAELALGKALAARA
jgi:methyl-accepting chemotaxis protein